MYFDFVVGQYLQQKCLCRSY